MADKSLARRYYDAWFEESKAEEELDDALLKAFGADPHDPDNWPCGNLTYDWYDASFELHGTRDDFAFTDEHLEAAWALGFARGWICFNDGTEIYVSPTVRGERKPSHHGPSERKREKRRLYCPKCRSGSATSVDAVDPVDGVTTE